MDLIGTVMGFVTIPMALFSIASVLAGLVLLLSGATHTVLIGLAGFVVASAIAVLLERHVIWLDARAIMVGRRHGRGRARYVAAIAGILPMLILLAWEMFAFHIIMAEPVQASPLTLWLWSYGTATGPWTAFALHAGRDRRTLCSIRAYAGHLAYWLFSFLVLLCDAPIAMAGTVMLLPAILPITVGCLLAVANRNSLRNVRI